MLLQNDKPSPRPHIWWLTHRLAVKSGSYGIDNPTSHSGGQSVVILKEYWKHQIETNRAFSAIVTGASRGIGKAIALDLASHGAKVVFTYTSDRSKQPAEELVSQIKNEANSSAVSIQCNLLYPEAPRDILKAAQDAFGSKIDILVNNAAMITDKYVQDITIDHFDEVFHLNVRAPMLMIQAVLPHMRRPGKFAERC